MAEGAKGKKPKIIGFYYRKILFFAVISFFCIFLADLVKSNQLGADTAKEIFGNESNKREFNVVIQKDGHLLVDGKEVSDRLKPVDNYDELRLLVLDNPGQYYQSVQIKLTLPDSVSSSVKKEILAIHGVGESSASIYDGTTVIYQAVNVSPTATLTIVAKLPKGIIEPTFTDQIVNLLIGAKNQFWLFLAILLPALTLLLMIAFLTHLRQRQHIEMPDKEISNPPMAIPPAVVGVLFNQKVGSREIAATLVDLALRGDLVILDQDRGFAFGKGHFDQRLLEFEKILLSKIFKDGMSSDKEMIDQRINSHLYSKKISLASAGIYSLATMLGYFKVNPQKTHMKYRMIGIAFLALGLAGFFLSMFYFKEPAYLVFFWVGMMISSLIIVFMAGYLPTRTVIGQEVLTNWLAFKKYLSNPEKIEYSEDLQATFQRYLPYAIVMNCESAWAKRFSEHNFVMPDWFLTEKIGLGLEDFCLSLFPIVSYVGRSLVALKEPGFE